MKKTLLIIAFVMQAYIASAQLLSKNGTPILPDSADWAIGFDAASVFKMIGNVFYNSIDTADWFTASSPAMTIYGKKCVSANKFYRVKARLAFGSQTQNYPVVDINTDNDKYPTSADSVAFDIQYGNDESKYSWMNITLSAGMEKRLGKGRVQGYWGPEVLVGFGNSKTSNTFYNSIDSLNLAITSTSPSYTFSGGIDPSGNKRITEIKNPSIFNFGIRAFAGVEYFFMAGASIGAEFGWGIAFSSQGATETTTEYFESNLDNSAGGVLAETKESQGKNSSFGIDTDQAYGAINLFFYFGGGAK
ncbi:MAG: hypothetical protein ACHQNT_07390 [Bacteroidia bacterium]